MAGYYWPLFLPPPCPTPRLMPTTSALYNKENSCFDSLPAHCVFLPGGGGRHLGHQHSPSRSALGRDQRDQLCLSPVCWRTRQACPTIAWSHVFSFSFIFEKFIHVYNVYRHAPPLPGLMCLVLVLFLKSLYMYTMYLNRIQFLLLPASPTL